MYLRKLNVVIVKDFGETGLTKKNLMHNTQRLAFASSWCALQRRNFTSRWRLNEGKRQT